VFWVEERDDALECDTVGRRFCITVVDAFRCFAMGRLNGKEGGCRNGDGSTVIDAPFGICCSGRDIADGSNV
jgi:hypothetical protein